MVSDSVWLGSGRSTVFKLAKLVSGITVLVWAGMVINRLFFGGNGMYELLRPEGGIMATAIMVLIGLTVIMWSIYLSDFKGAIETEQDGIFDKVSLVLSRVAMISIIAIEVVMLYEVVSRYVFNAPTLWANEMSLWIASILFLLAGVYAMQQRSHIRIYVIYDMCPRWAKKAADTVTVALITLFSFCLVWGGYNEALLKFTRMEKYGTAWNPPIPATVKPLILILIVLVTLQAISNLIADWNKDDSHSPEDEIDQTEIENIRKTLEK